MTNSSKRLTKSGNRINQTFGGRHFKTVLQAQNYFLNCYKYVYSNPLRAGLVKQAESYPYSTLHGLLGMNKLLIPTVEDDTLFGDVEGTLRWLNKPVDREHAEAMRVGLKHPFFAAKKNTCSNRSMIPEWLTI